MDRTSVRPRPAAYVKAPEGRYALAAERDAGAPFNPLRCARAVTLTATGADGAPFDALAFLVGDQLLLGRADGAGAEPTCAVALGGARGAVPTALAAPPPGRDVHGAGPLLLVGMSNGDALLLSLASHLGGAPSGRPALLGTFSPAGEAVAGPDARVAAVAWTPLSGGHGFVSAQASGAISVHRAAAAVAGVAEAPAATSGSGRFSLGLGGASLSGASASSSAGAAGASYKPTATMSCPAGVSDLSYSPDGRLLAAACRDGALRVHDAATGAVVGGARSYYGALLCCAFSHDGRYVALGGEDDLVALYGVRERGIVAYGEAHGSFVQRIAFDPWMCAALEGAAGGGGGGGEAVYRLASVGQDQALALWDFAVDEEAASAAEPAAAGPLRRNGSASWPLAAAGGAEAGGSRWGVEAVNAHRRTGSGGVGEPLHRRIHSVGSSLSRLADEASSGAAPGAASNASGSGGALFGLGGSGGGGGSKGRSAGGAAANGGGPGGDAVLAPSAQRADMVFVPPVVAAVRVGAEPMSDVLFTATHMLTVDCTGAVRAWKRPIS